MSILDTMIRKLSKHTGLIGSVLVLLFAMAWASPIPSVNAQADTVEISLVLQGGGTTVTLGQEFTVLLQAADIRASTETVFSAFADVAFDNTVLEVQSVSYGANFPYLNQGTTDQANGLVDELGAVSDVFAKTSGASTVAEVVFVPVATGATAITPSVADDVLSETTIFGDDFDQRDNPDDNSDTDDITYTALNLTINPNLVVDTTNDTTDVATDNGICSDGTACSLRSAIMEANDDTEQTIAFVDEISLPAGTYNLGLSGAGEDATVTGDLDITDDLIIIGADRDTTIIDGNALDRVFDVKSGNTVTFKNVTIQNGSANFGAGIFNGGALTLDNVKLTNNNATAASGSLVAGAAIANTSGTLTIQNGSLIDGNTSTGTGTGGSFGGAIFNGNIANITDSTITGNVTTTQDAQASGGGVYNTGTLSLTNSTLSSNEATRTGSTVFAFGGGIDNLGGNTTLDNVLMVDNFATSGGGAMSNRSTNSASGVINITNNSQIGTTSNPGTFTPGEANFSGFGGAIYNVGSATYPVQVTISNSTLQGNVAITYGGGIINYFGTLTINNNSVFDSNQGLYGGGVINYNNATVNVDNTTFSNNAGQNLGGTEGLGGGIFNGPGGTLNVANTTFDGNSAFNNGGAIWNGLKNDTLPVAAADVSSSVFVNNTAQYGAAIHNAFGGFFEGNNLEIGIDSGVAGANAASQRGAIYNSGTLTRDDVTTNVVQSAEAANVNVMPALEMMANPDADSVDVGRPVLNLAVDESSRMVLSNSVVANNTSGLGGSGLVNTSAGNGSFADPGVVLRNVTMTDVVVMLNGEDAGTSILNLEYTTLGGSMVTNSQTVNAFHSVFFNSDGVGNNCNGTVALNVGSYSDDGTCGVTNDAGLSLSAFNGFEYPLTGGTAVDLQVPNGSGNCYVDRDNSSTFTAGDVEITTDADGTSRPIDTNCDAGSHEAPAGVSPGSSIIAAPSSPRLVSPTGGAISAEPTFIWTNDAVSERYLLSVSDANGVIFERYYTMRDSCPSNFCTATPILNLQDGMSYQWRVQAELNGQTSEWASSIDFVVDASLDPVTLDTNGMGNVDIQVVMPTPIPPFSGADTEGDLQPVASPTSPPPPSAPTGR